MNYSWHCCPSCCLIKTNPHLMSNLVWEFTIHVVKIYLYCFNYFFLSSGCLQVNRLSASSSNSQHWSETYTVAAIRLCCEWPRLQSSLWRYACNEAFSFFSLPKPLSSFFSLHFALVYFCVSDYVIQSSQSFSSAFF